MEEIAGFIFGFIHWVVVPLIIIALFVTGLRLKSPERKYRTSTSAGKLAGFVVFVLIVLLFGTRDVVFSFRTPPMDFQPLPFAAAIVVAFAGAKAMEYLAKLPIVGFCAMALVASSLSSLYFYLLTPDNRPLVLFLALGIALGVLIELMVFRKDA